MSATWSPACCSWRARPACLAGPFSMTMLYAPVAEQPQNKLPIARWTTLYYQNGVFINRRRRNDCSEPLEIEQKKSRQLWGFWYFCSRLLANFNGLSQDGGRANFDENLCAFPFKFNKQLYRITQLSVDPSWTDLWPRRLKINFSSSFWGKWWSHSELNLCICFQKVRYLPFQSTSNNYLQE